MMEIGKIISAQIQELQTVAVNNRVLSSEEPAQNYYNLVNDLESIIEEQESSQDMSEEKGLLATLKNLLRSIFKIEFKDEQENNIPDDKKAKEYAELGQKYMSLSGGSVASMKEALSIVTEMLKCCPPQDMPALLRDKKGLENDLSKVIDLNAPEDAEDFEVVFAEFNANVPSQTVSISQKELALEFIERILNSNAASSIKSFWSMQGGIISGEIDQIKAMDPEEAEAKGYLD